MPPVKTGRGRSAMTSAPLASSSMRAKARATKGSRTRRESSMEGVAIRDLLGIAVLVRAGVKVPLPSGSHS